MDHDDVFEIVLLAEDAAVADKLEVLSDDAFVRESAGFDGLDTLIVAFTTLSVPLINSITKIVLEQVRARKHVKLRFGKTVIEGVSEDKVTELLERLSRDVEK